MELIDNPKYNNLQKQRKEGEREVREEGKLLKWNPLLTLSVHPTLLPEEELEEDSFLLCKNKVNSIDIY